MDEIKARKIWIPVLGWKGQNCFSSFWGRSLVFSCLRRFRKKTAKIGSFGKPRKFCESVFGTKPLFAWWISVFGENPVHNLWIKSKFKKSGFPVLSWKGKTAFRHFEVDPLCFRVFGDFRKKTAKIGSFEKPRKFCENTFGTKPLCDWRAFVFGRNPIRNLSLSVVRYAHNLWINPNILYKTYDFRPCEGCEILLRMACPIHQHFRVGTWLSQNFHYFDFAIFAFLAKLPNIFIGGLDMHKQLHKIFRLSGFPAFRLKP